MADASLGTKKLVRHKAPKFYTDVQPVAPERVANIARQGENILRILRQFGADAALASICKYTRGIAPIDGGSLYVRIPSAKPVIGIMEKQSKGAEFTPMRKEWEVPPEAIPYPVDFGIEGSLVVEPLDFLHVIGEEWDKFRAYKSFARIKLASVAENNATYYLGFWSLHATCFTDTAIAEISLLIEDVREEMVRDNLSVLPQTASALELPDDSDIRLLFANPDMLPVQRKILRIAPTHAIALVMGETGTGKELVAKVIHKMSPYKNGELMCVNCGAIPESLLESDLFGHEKGAFTGALSAKKGFFEQAKGGSIFLDEIGELSLGAQTRLLRVLETREIRRVGGISSIAVDCRVIAATNRDLAAMVAAGSFRKDLWYRLSIFPIIVPALRYRLRDISMITQHLVEKLYRSFGLKEKPYIRPEAFEVLFDHHWPGNVRELENVVSRALITFNPENGQDSLVFDVTPPISKSAWPTGGSSSSETQASAPSANIQPGPDFPKLTTWPTLEEVETFYIRQVMEKCGNHIFGKNGAAAILGTHPTTLQSRWKKIQEKQAAQPSSGLLKGLHELAPE